MLWLSNTLTLFITLGNSKNISVCIIFFFVQTCIVSVLQFVEKWEEKKPLSKQ